MGYFRGAYHSNIDEEVPDKQTAITELIKNSLTRPLWAINNNNMEITEIIQRLESDMLSHKSESYTTVNQFNVGLHHEV